MFGRTTVFLAICALLAGCTSKVRLVNRDILEQVRPLPVAMEPPLAGLEAHAKDRTITLEVPTGQLLAYHFIGVAPGGQPPATLHLVHSDLDLDSSGAQTAGLLGIVGAPIYLSMVDGYKCQYAILVEAIAPDGARRLLAGRGEGRASVSGEAAVRDAMVQAVDNLHEQVQTLLAASSATTQPSTERLEPASP